jgi:hypothetical protein
MSPESKGPKIRMTFSDGESVGSVEASAAQPGSEVVFSALNNLAMSFNDAKDARTSADPEYRAVVAERDATPWYRFRQRKKLSELALELHQEAWVRNIENAFGSMEVLGVENQPQQKSIQDN